MGFEYYNLFGELLVEDDEKTSYKKIKDINGDNIKALDYELLFIAGVNKKLNNPYKTYLINDCKNLIQIFEKYESNILEVADIFLKKYNQDGRIKFVEKSGNGNTDINNWFSQNCSSKSDLICYDSDEIPIYKISLKKDTSYQLTSCKILSESNDIDLIWALKYAYGDNIEWVNRVIDICKYINDTLRVDIKNHIGHLEKNEKTIELEEYGNRLQKIISNNFDINSECGRKFIMEFANGNTKFGKDSLCSANLYIITDYINDISFESYNDDEYYNHLKLKNITDKLKIKFSYKTISTSSVNYDLRIYVNK